MKYRTARITVKRKDLYEHFKKNTELSSVVEETTNIAEVNDENALVQIINSLNADAKEWHINEYNRKNESKRSNTKGGAVCEVLQRKSA